MKSRKFLTVLTLFLCMSAIFALSACKEAADSSKQSESGSNQLQSESDSESVSDSESDAQESDSESDSENGSDENSYDPNGGNWVSPVPVAFVMGGGCK